MQKQQELVVNDLKFTRKALDDQVSEKLNKADNNGERALDEIYYFKE